MSEAKAVWRGLAGVHALADRIEEWARDRKDVRALAFFGSLRRQDRPGDDWSDVDALLLVDDLAAWTAQRDARWVHDIAPVWINLLHPAPVPGINVRQVIFDGGYDSDLIVVDREKLKIFTDDPATARLVLGHGYTVAFDHDDAFANMPPPADGADVSLPDADEFHFVVSTTLYQMIWATKHFRRGEHWRAFDDLNGYMKERLLKLLEWQALAAGSKNVFPAARKLETWAPQAELDAARSTYASGNPQAFPAALLAHHDLTRSIARPLAKRLGFDYPDEADRYISSWVVARLAEARQAA
jgi:aminoglycoside 6-adenylyltransferase